MLKKLLPSLVVLAILGFGLWSLQLDWSALFHGDLGQATTALQAAVAAEGPYKELTLTLLIALLPFVMVPITALLLSAAILLPPMAGFRAILFGSAINTALSYFVGRTWGEEAIRLFGLERFKFMEKLRQGARRHGFKLALLSRIMPVPFCLPAMAAAMVGIRFNDMLGGSTLMMLPWAILYAFFSEAIRQGQLKLAAPILAGIVLLSLGLAWLRNRGSLDASGGASALPEELLQPQEPPLGPELTLYTLPGLAACEEARRELRRLRPLLKFEVREFDLRDQPQLLEAYQDLVPLLFHGSKRLFSFQIDENALELHLRNWRD